MKRYPKPDINKDERWILYDEIKKSGDIIKATALKQNILDSYKWKKPCQYM